MPNRLRLTGFWSVMTLAVVACGAWPAPAPTSPGASVVATTAFTLTSSAFEDGGAIPEQYGCGGADVSPPLEWSGVPQGTQELVLIVDDPDANGFLHWLLTDISLGTSGELAEDAGDAQTFPDGQAMNDFGRRGYRGPCPPRRHAYAFTLYALSRPLDGNTPLTKIAVQAAMADRLLADASLHGTYKRES